MDDIRFDNFARALAENATRRGFVGAVAALAAGAFVGRAGAACSSDQFFRRGMGCVCRTTGRPPDGELCPCRNGQVHCHGVCVDLSRDTDNCGACDAACPEPVPGTCQGSVVCRAGSCELRPASAGTVCRPAAGPCDEPEVCDGVSLDCPPDEFLSAETVCRPAAGDCDVEEVCDGTGPDCPPDVFLGQETVCRPTAGPCDVEERCPGNNPHCPPDAFKGADVVCEEGERCLGHAHCTGEGPDCPSRVTLQDHTQCLGEVWKDLVCCGGFCQECCNSKDADCDDGNPCTRGTCRVIVCEQHPVCDDDDPCTFNNCDPATGTCSFPVKDDGASCGKAGQVCCDGICVAECCDASYCEHLVSDCVEVACLSGQCTSFELPDVEGQSCGDNATCRTINNVMRCVECETNAECPQPANVCIRAVCDASFTCVEEVRQFESCGEGATCNATANCVCSHSTVTCSGGQVVGGSCGDGDCACAATAEGLSTCTDLSDLRLSTTSCGDSRFCEFAGPGFSFLGFCIYDPCRAGYFCAMPCGGVE